MESACSEARAYEALGEYYDWHRFNDDEKREFFINRVMRALGVSGFEVPDSVLDEAIKHRDHIFNVKDVK